MCIFFFSNERLFLPIEETEYFYSHPFFEFEYETQSTAKYTQSQKESL